MSFRKFLYFPSLSNGEFGAHLIENYKIKDKLSVRYYNSEYGKFRHPYFLLSAGHNMKKTKSDYGFEDDTVVLGDSGGYQICSGAKKWKPELKEQVFEWLEANTNIAINLDIPPRGNWSGRFNESLDISMKNFDYFHTNMTGKTDFLNVLQGTTISEIKQWYKSAKVFDKFSGWSFGGAGGKASILIAMLAQILEGKEHLQPHNKYLHVLGTTSILEVLILATIQNAFNEINSPMQVTTDSSSPNRAVLFGTYYMGMNWNNMSYSTINMPYRKDVYVDDFSIPYVTEFDHILKKIVKYEDVKVWESVARDGITLHNIYVFISIINQLSDLVYSKAGLLQQLMTTKEHNKILLFLMTVDKLIKSDNPWQFFEDHFQIWSSINMPSSATSNSDHSNWDVDGDFKKIKTQVKNNQGIRAQPNTDLSNNFFNL